MLRTAFLVLSGNAATAVINLARSLIVARMIPVADFGIAATLTIAVAVIEMLSSLGLQQQIIQARDGDDPRLQSALQGFALLRGVISGTLIFLLAEPMANLMSLPQVVWGYRAMALVPILHALVHFDVARFSRRMSFGPMILNGLVPAIVGLLVVWPLNQVFGDWRVVLFAILTQTLVLVLMSHLSAERRFAVRLDREIMRRSLRFGWPLLVNGVLLFGVMNGDRLIIGRELGVEALAIFSMGMTLTLAPTLVMARSLQNVFLSQLSRTRAKADDDGGVVAATGARVAADRFARQATAAIQATLLTGLVFVTATVVAGGPVVYLLLGDKYLVLLPFLIWFAIMQVARVFKAGPAIVALAAGETSNAMFANLVRVMTLPFTFWVAATSGDFVAILLIVTAGEVAGQAVALALLRLRAGVRLAPVLPAHALAALILVVAGGQALALGGRDPTLAAGFAPWPVTVGLLVLLGLAVGTMPELRRAVLRRDGLSRR